MNSDELEEQRRRVRESRGYNRKKLGLLVLNLRWNSDTMRRCIYFKTRNEELWNSSFLTDSFVFAWFFMLWYLQAFLLHDIWSGSSDLCYTSTWYFDKWCAFLLHNKLWVMTTFHFWMILKVVIIGYLSEHTFIVLDKQMIMGEFVHGQPHTEGRFVLYLLFWALWLCGIYDIPEYFFLYI